MDLRGALILGTGAVFLALLQSSPWGMALLILAVVGSRAGRLHDDRESLQTVLVVCGAVAVTWFLLFGWMTDFPGLTTRVADQPSGWWFLVSTVVVTGVLCGFAALCPEVRAAWTTGAWTWWVLSVWGTTRLESTDAAFAFVTWAMVGLVMIGLAEVARALALRRE